MADLLATPSARGEDDVPAAVPAPGQVRHRPGRGAVLAACWLLAGAVAVVLAVALGGAAPQPVPPGLADPGPLPGWGLPVLRLLGHAAAVTTVSALLVGVLGGRSRAGTAAAAAALWALLGAGSVLLGLAEVVGRPVHELGDVELLRYWTTQVPQGRAQLLSVVLALWTAGVAVAARRRTAVAAALALALAAPVPLLLTGHAATEGDHRLAQAALVAHVLPALLWTGAVAALALVRHDRELDVLAARTSALALGCAVLVTGSGVASAVLALGRPGALLTGYGALVLGKAVALVLLLLAGAQHRRRTLPLLRAGRPRALRRLAAGEVAVMAVALGLAAALSRTPLP